jgi:3-oxoacyl-[acyl-carrier-protein] synthase II
VPPTLNYKRPDPQCPVRVVHKEPMSATKPVGLVLNHSANGHTVAVILASPD